MINPDNTINFYSVSARLVYPVLVCDVKINPENVTIKMDVVLFH